MEDKELKMLVVSNFVGDITTHEHAVKAELDPEKVFAADGVAQAIEDGGMVYEILTNASGWVYPLPMFTSFRTLDREHYAKFRKFRDEYEGFVGKWLRS